MTDHTLEDRLAPIAADLAAVQAQIKDLQDREDTLKEQIRKLADTPDRYAAGPLTVTISLNRRFNPARALTLIPDVLRPLVVEQVETVNGAKLKVLDLTLWEQSTDSGAHKVILK